MTSARDALIFENAPAKINLALHLRRKRADGFHDLETIFAFARHGDAVTVRLGAGGLVVTGPFAAGLETGPGNLVCQAEAIFARLFAIPDQHTITLQKRLPLASGIGGGSADAAATLRALARLHHVYAGDPRLLDAARALGADVPACLVGDATVGSGKGDVLEAIAGLGDMPALLVNPLVPMPTGPVFARWDRKDLGPLPEGGTLARALAGRNDLQPGAERLAPVIGEVIAALQMQAGVRLARMSGSGATCFALFDDLAARDRADALIGARHPAWWRMATTIV